MKTAVSPSGPVLVATTGSIPSVLPNSSVKLTLRVATASEVGFSSPDVTIAPSIASPDVTTASSLANTDTTGVVAVAAATAKAIAIFAYFLFIALLLSSL